MTTVYTRVVSAVSARGLEGGRGATTAEKLRGTKVWVSTPGRFNCGREGAGGGRPSRCESPGVSLPENF